MVYKPLVYILSFLKAKRARSLVISIASFSFTCSVLANPVVDNVAAGQVSIQQTQSTTTVNQNSQKAIINWQSFNIGAGEHTHFQQPAGGIALNRISPNQGASSIYGQLTATGQIILINPAGIYFGPSAFVNVGGLVATTHNITDANFLSGNFSFNKVDPHSGAVINEGTIVAAQHGLVALVAPSVVNNGMIQANLGKVVLASGNAFTMSFDGNGLINFAVTEATTSRGRDRNGVELSDGIKNTGSLIANGGTIMVSGKAASGVLDHVINMEGLAQAQSVMEQNGKIILSADTDAANNNVIRVAGKLDASGKKAGEKGGKVQVTSKYIFADSGAHIDVSGDIGGGEVYLGGNYLGQGPLPNATAVVTASNTSINADAITNGKGGHVILWSDEYTNVNTNISARGGAQGGDGGFIETSSKNLLNVGDITVSTSAANGNTGLWLLDPRNVIISTGSTSGGSFDGGSPTDIFTPTGDDAVVNVTTLESNLASTNVTITTGSDGAQDGNITVDSQIDWSADTLLTLNPAATGSVILNQNILGTGAASGLLIDGALTLSGSRTLQAGDINVTGNITGSGTQTLTLNNIGTNSTLAGVISSGGTLNLTKEGTGTLILSGNNTYTGITTINAGTITATNNNALGAADNTSATGTVINSDATLTLSTADVGDEFITLNGGTLSGAGSTPSLSGNIEVTANSNIDSPTHANFTHSGNINLAANLTSNVDGGNASIVFSGIISDDNNTRTLTKIGAGTLVLSNANTFGGDLFINAGQLSLHHVNGLGDGTAIVASGATLSLSGTLGTITNALNLAGTGTSNNGALSNSGNNTFSGDITLTANTSISVASAANTLTLSGVIADGGNNYTLTKLSFGRLALSNANTFGGGLFIDGGTLMLNHVNGLGDGTAVVASGATLNIVDTLGGTITNALSLAGTGASSNGALANVGTNIFSGDITLTANTTISSGNSSSYSLALSGVINDGGNAYTLSKIGAGSALALSGNNTYSGGTTITSGTLNLQHASGLGTGMLTVSNNTRLLLEADLGAPIANALSLRGTGVSSSGAITTNSNNIFSGDITLTDSSVSIGVTDSNASLLLSGIISGGRITNTNPALTKIGTGTLVLSGSNTYTGNTVVSAGTLALANNTGAGTNTSTSSTANNIQVASGATLAIDSTDGAVSIGRYISATGTGVGSNGAILGIGENSTITNTVHFSSATTLGVNTDGTLTISGELANNTAAALTKAGSGMLILAGNNSYTGATTINGGTLQLSGSGRLSDSSAVTIGASGTFDLNDISDTIGSLAGSGAVLLGSGTLTTGNANNTTFSGVISETGSLVKQGSGNFILSGNNTFDGGVTLSNGTLTVAHDNALGTGTLTFNNGLLQNSGTRSISNAISLGGTAQITAAAGTVLTLNGNINGGQALTLNGTGSFALGGAIGNSTAINSLTVGTALALNGSAITTVGNQTYNGLVTANSNTAITTTNAGATAISFNAGVAGASDVSVSGNAAGNNTLLVNSGGTQNWTINAANGGLLGGITGYSGAFTYADIHNLTGGSGNDNFTLNGGTLAGSIAGGGGTNSLTGNNTTNTWTITAANTGSVNGITGGFSAIQNLIGGSGNDSFTLSGGTLAGSIAGGGGTNTLTADNIANTWNLSGTNAATSMTGVGGGFSAIQNLVGGTGDDNFIFANNALITGTISGGVTLTNTGNNILDFSAYSTLVNAYMTSGSNEFIGNVRNSGNSIIANYSNIDHLIGNAATNNTITLPTGKNLNVVTFNPGSTRNGYISDPLYFDFFTIVGEPVPPAPTPTPTPTPVPPTIDVAQIVQQPSTSGTNNVNVPVSSSPVWVHNSISLTKNMTTLIQQITNTFHSDLENIKITPHWNTNTSMPKTNIDTYEIH